MEQPENRRSVDLGPDVDGTASAADAAGAALARAPTAERGGAA